MKQNDSLLKLLIIIFLFFFLLFAVSLLKPSPVNAGTFTIPPLAAHHSYAYWDSTYEILYDQLAIVQTAQGIYSCKTNSSGIRLLAMNNYLYLRPNVNGYGCAQPYKWDTASSKWVYSSSGQYLMDINSSISSNVYTPVSVYIDINSSMNFGSRYNNLGTLGPGMFIVAEPNFSFASTPLDEPVLESNFQYYMEYKNNYAMTGYHRVEFNGDMFISSSYAVGANLLGFDSDWELYYVDGTAKTLLDDSSNDYPPYLQITDTNNPCANILRSNYVLIDDLGTAICMATVNPIIENLAPPYTGLINFDPTAQDWGAFEWFEDVVVWFTDIINDVVGWFYGLWTNLLNLIIPTPDIFAFFAQDIKVAFQEHFPTELIATLTDVFDDMENMSDDEIPVIQGSLMGIPVNFVDFSLIDSSMYIIRPILTSMLIFIIIITYIKLFQLYFAKN